MTKGESPPSVPGAGGPRSEGTRRTILEAARATFAARGYEQTTIRAVAAQSGIDASMVMRYFGSKAGLFAAASTVDLHPPDLRSVSKRARGELLARHLIERWELSPRDDSLVILLRTAVTHDDVAKQLQNTFNTMIAEPIAAIGDPQAARRSALIASQLLGVALCRYILKLQPLASLAVDEVVASVAPTVQRYLTE